jgi:hypothetical protein
LIKSNEGSDTNLIDRSLTNQSKIGDIVRDRKCSYDTPSGPPNDVASSKLENLCQINSNYEESKSMDLANAKNQL